MKQLDEIVGIDRIRAFHLNDSKRRIGQPRRPPRAHRKGHLGREAFRNILNDPRFVSLPMYLETPKGVVNGRNLDAQNLATLRRLAGSIRKPSYNRKRR